MEKWLEEIRENPEVRLLHVETVGMDSNFGYAIGILEVKNGGDVDPHYQSFCVNREFPEWLLDGPADKVTVRERDDFNSAWADLGLMASHARTAYRHDVGPVSFPGAAQKRWTDSKIMTEQEEGNLKDALEMLETIQFEAYTCNKRHNEMMTEAIKKIENVLNRGGENE